METWQCILMWILIGIVGLYILLIIVNLLFVFSFLRTMKKHNKALYVLYTSKFDNIKKISAFLLENNVKMSPEFDRIIETLDCKKFANQDDPDCIEAKRQLTYLHQEILFALSKNQELLDSPVLALLKNNVEEIDRNLRLNVIVYNADVLGYNYWIRFLPCRYIFLLAKTKTKETI